METTAQSNHLVSSESSNIKDWISQIFNDIPLKPDDQATIALFQSEIRIEEQRITDETVAAIVRKFQTDGSKRRRQCHLLECCLAQLQARFKIMASPSPRVLVSEPERHYIDISQARFLQVISTVRSFLEAALKAPVTDNWGRPDFSIFLLRLIFEQRVLNPKQIEDIFERHYRLVSFDEQFWLEKDDDRILISSDFVDWYRGFALLKYNPSRKTLCTWMSNNLFGYKLSFSCLCKAGLLSARLQNGVFFAELSAQRIKTTPLSTTRWRQLLGQKLHISVVPSVDDKPLPIRAQRQWKQHAPKSFTQSADTQYASLSNRLKPVLNASGQQRATELTKLRLWLENEDNSTKFSWEWLLTCWCYWLVLHGGKRKSKLGKSSISRYVQFARPLLQSLGAQDVWDGSSDQWIMVIEEAATKAGSGFQPTTVERFVSFLVSNGIAPDLHISDIDLPNIQSNVDANMLVPADVELLLVALRCFDSELARISRLLLCFGFACGLRRGEALGLKKDNLRFCKLPYLALRHNSARSLKRSTRGRRNLPLDLFWPDEEYQLLLEYSASPAVVRADLLFYDQPLALAALELLTDLMRETTGQPHFRFHHLRHSYANWCFWLLHMPRIDLRVTPVFFRHPWLDQQRSVFLRQRLGLSADLIARRDLHTLAILMGHTTPITTMHSYIHISDIVNTALRSPQRPQKCVPVGYRSPEPDKDILQILTGLLAIAHNKKKGKTTVSVYPIKEIGQAIYQLTNSRHIRRDEHVAALLLKEIDSVYSKGSVDPKVKAVMEKVMRKKVPLRVIVRFRAWLQLLDERQWFLSFTQKQVEEIINMTDPGKDFLFICRSLHQVELLVRWLELLEINPSEIYYRLCLTTRCHQYFHTENPLQQITAEVEHDYQAGILKNLAAPKGRAKKRQPTNEPIDRSDLRLHKFFTCEVHVRWDNIGNGVKRRNQALIGVLKAMWLSSRLREAV